MRAVHPEFQFRAQSFDRLAAARCPYLADQGTRIDVVDCASIAADRDLVSSARRRTESGAAGGTCEAHQNSGGN